MGNLSGYFTKVRMCGQHPGMMSRVGVGWVISYVFSFLHVSEQPKHILFFFAFFGLKD